MVYPALLPLMRTPRLPAVNWNDNPLADLNGLVRFTEIRNMVSARVPSHFNWLLPHRRTLFSVMAAWYQMLFTAWAKKSNFLGQGLSNSLIAAFYFIRFNCLGYIKKYANSETRTNTVCFRRLLLARIQLSGLSLLTVRTVRSTHPSLAVQLASLTPGKVNEVELMF